MSSDDTSPSSLSPSMIGHKVSSISVELSTQFLKHFSEQLYSSPQKAFEELISNGWDAGADFVDVRIPLNLDSPDASLCVLDNGISMNEEGLRALWHIAFSPKQNVPEQYGRRLIGKFGIGKLATYVLASKLTYICKSSDGVIRRVTMDYGSIDKHSSAETLISKLTLPMFEVTEAEFMESINKLQNGKEIISIIETGFAYSDGATAQDEYGGFRSKLEKPSTDTWTLVILSELKPAGQNLKTGILKRMLEAALPFGSEMRIQINDEPLQSSKADVPVLKEWTIGPEVGITELEFAERTADEAAEDGSAEVEAKASLPVTSTEEPFPQVVLPEVGPVTGTIRIFEEKISKGKSEERGASNGYHVNVLGRIVNQADPSFGEENLSHAVWARFRMTVRADGLNPYLTTNREQFQEQPALKIFRAFLRKAFNLARNYYDNESAESGMPHGGDVLVRSLGVLSLSPLRNVVSDALAGQAPLPDLFDERGIADRVKKREAWRRNTSENIGSALEQVKYEKSGDESFVKFRLSDNSVIINKDHPFVAEYSRTRAEKDLLRTVAMVNLLSDVYAIDIGVEPTLLRDVRAYRDRLMRFRALQSRRSGVYIAQLLLQTQHDSENSKKLEAVVSDALRYLGFEVRDLAKPGEPEGIASAFSTPTKKAPTLEDPNPALYTFSFDAKSSKNPSAKTGNLGLVFRS